MIKIVDKLLHAGEGRRLKTLQEQTQRVTDLEPDVAALSDEQLRAKTAEFRERHDNGEMLDDLLFEAFAVAREAGRRALGMRPFDVQVLGGIVLHDGDIAEMKTGEGKTLVATMPMYLNGLSGHGAHLVTVNDYLAKRDAEWMGQVYRFLGLEVGVIQANMTPEERRAQYNADVTYGTNSEFGFDYLRDNMTMRREHMVQRGHAFCIVDEVDSILIDEARTPLIISGAPETAADTYRQFARVVPRLIPGEDYEVDEKQRTVAVTESGVAKVERALDIDNLYKDSNGGLVNHFIQALRAEALYAKDVEYVVQNGEVLIVDEFTGRILEGRRYSEGLHQAIEAKEKVPIREENQTLATITLQNYFRMYDVLAGMTGTAKTEEDEFRQIYQLEVVQIPTNSPMVRLDENDYIFTTAKEKYAAVVEDVVERYEMGQPVLVGTVSVEVSEMLSRLLERHGVEHNVLNAKQHEREAHIIENAGQKGAITIATNMAGRGVDIKLGEGVIEAGGLYVLGTERHESRRIDNQLRGRSGRQGDPGESRFYLSAEDELIRLFAGDRMFKILSRLGPQEGQPIEAKMLSSVVEKAQVKVEELNFMRRKNVLKYDEVMNEQRRVIYDQRQRILMGEDFGEQVREMVAELVESSVRGGLEGEQYSEDWDLDSLFIGLKQLYSPALKKIGHRRGERHGRRGRRPRGGRRARAVRRARARDRRGADAQRGARRHAPGHRRPLEGPPARHGLPAGGHPPAGARAAGPAGRVQERGVRPLQRHARERQDQHGHHAHEEQPRGPRDVHGHHARRAGGGAQLHERRRPDQPDVVHRRRHGRRRLPGRRRLRRPAAAQCGRRWRRARGDHHEHCAGPGAAAGRLRQGRAQRPVPVRKREEVQEVSRSLSGSAAPALHDSTSSRLTARQRVVSRGLTGPRPRSALDGPSCE